MHIVRTKQNIVGFRSNYGSATHHRKEFALSGITLHFWWMKQLAEDTNFCIQLQSFFWLNEFVIKQKRRVWSDKKSITFHTLPTNPKNCTERCGLWAGGIIGPYCFKDNARRNVIVNGARYQSLISIFLLPKMEAMAVMHLWRRYGPNEKPLGYGPANWNSRSLFSKKTIVFAFQ